MRINILGVFVILLILSLPQEVAAQRVIVENGYAVIECSDMPSEVIKSPTELTLSKIHGNVRLHILGASDQRGKFDTSKFGTDKVYVNDKISRKFAIAPNDYPKAGARITWDDASGWLIVNNIVTDKKATGCALYQGKDNNISEKGMWRLPTQKELIIIYAHHGQLERAISGFGKFSDDKTLPVNEGIQYRYWSATEKDTPSRRYEVFFSMNFTSGDISTSAKAVKGDLGYTRCIKDIQ